MSSNVSATHREFFNEALRREVEAILDPKFACGSKYCGWTQWFDRWQIDLDQFNIKDKIRFILGSENPHAIAELYKQFGTVPDSDLADTDLIIGDVGSIVGHAFMAALRMELVLKGVDPEAMDYFASWVCEKNPPGALRKEVFKLVVQGRGVDEVEKFAEKSGEALAVA